VHFNRADDAIQFHDSCPPLTSNSRNSSRHTILSPPSCSILAQNVDQMWFHINQFKI
jgi:hypothetical protein